MRFARRLPPSRLEPKASDDPAVLTPGEQHINDLMRIENFERYSQQSKTGILPPRESLGISNHHRRSHP